jgi:uncharacterized SAM-binding protein YcdF (DUF218 family)
MINELKSHYIHFSLLLFVIIVLLQFNFFLFNIQSYENTDLNKKEIEGIVVLTGDKFRILEGLKILNSEIGYKLLISGVNKEISIEEIKKEFPKFNQLFNCCVELESISTNTFENVREIFFWKKNNNIKNILLITSDYHLPRVELEVNRLLLDKETFYYGVKYDNQKINIRMKKLIVEYIKYLRTKISLSIGL